MSRLSNLNQYQIMWVIVLFDLPSVTKKEKKVYHDFREKLKNDGFRLFQFSIYLRHCASKENANVHKKRIKNWLPPHGKVAVLTITDRQCGLMDLFFGPKKVENPNAPKQLELF